MGYLQRVFCGVFLSAIYLMDILDVGEYGQVMIEDIKMVGQLGVQGVAIGVLTEDNKINVDQVLKKTSLLLLALKSEFCQVFYWQTHGKLCGGMGFGWLFSKYLLLFLWTFCSSIFGDLQDEYIRQSHVVMVGRCGPCWSPVVCIGWVWPSIVLLMYCVIHLPV